MGKQDQVPFSFFFFYAGERLPIGVIIFTMAVCHVARGEALLAGSCGRRMRTH